MEIAQHEVEGKGSGAPASWLLGAYSAWQERLVGVAPDPGTFRVARLVLHPSSKPHLPHPHPSQGSIAELSKAIFLIDDRAVNLSSNLSTV